MNTKTIIPAEERIGLMEAIEQRHSVRQYLDAPLPTEAAEELAAAIREYNDRGRLRMQLITGETDAFSGIRAKYGKFSNVSSYIALVGEKAPDLEERCGYYGEKIVLLAQQMGLNTCWVGGTFSKSKTVFDVGVNEKLVLVISVGFGATPGHTRKSKSFVQVNRTKGEVPSWYRRGVEAALLAPTAVNQQKFAFSYAAGSGRSASDDDDAASGTGSAVPSVSAAVDGFGFFSKVDLGIVRCHFEIGAGDAEFRWV